MKIPAIKKAVESYTVLQLKQAEECLLNEQIPHIEIEGDDDGEKLTHTMAAIWIKEKMRTDALDFNTALRAYTSKVRASIS